MGEPKHGFRLKRVYEPVLDGDGERILVERLWPRGISKGDARLDAWLKDVAPSPELRKWYSHDVERWPEFRERYLAELSGQEKQDVLRDLAGKARTGPVTLVFAASDTEHNSALLLKEYLEDHYGA